MNIYILSIDPGKQGGVVLLGPGGSLEKWWKTPVIGKEYDLFQMGEIFYNAHETKPDYCAIKVCIESPQVRRKGGVKSAYSIGYGHGLWHMAIIGFELPMEIIKPQSWQVGIPGLTCRKKKMKDGVLVRDKDGMQVYKTVKLSGTPLKLALAAEALRRCPSIPCGPRSGKPHSGISDAYLMGVHHQREIIGGGE